MTDGMIETIFETDDHCAEAGTGAEVCVSRDEIGRITRVAIINEADEEMIELEPEVALGAAKALVALLEKDAMRKQSMPLGIVRSLH